MNQQETTEKKNELECRFAERIVFLQLQIENLTIEYQKSLATLQGELNSLTLQSDALKAYTIK